MIKENKLKIILSYIVTLLPAVFGICMWGRLEESEFSNVVNVETLRWTTVFLIPGVMLALNTACILLFHFGFGGKDQNKKVITMAFSIIPAISVYTSVVFYSLLLGINVDYKLVISLMLGSMFIVMGNYMPKCKQNATMGLKVRWSLANEDNWNATHRVAGIVMFCTGFAVLPLWLLPTPIFFITFFTLTLLTAIIPTVYSYLYYKNNLKSGKQTEADYNFKAYGKYTKIIAIIVIPVIIAAIIPLMFLGNIEYELDGEKIEISAAFSKDTEIEYSDIVKIEYRDSKNAGDRVMGFASARLLMGTFKNDEFNAYTRYSYTKCNAEIIVYTTDGIIVINEKTPEATKTLYDKLKLELEQQGE